MLCFDISGIDLVCAGFCQPFCVRFPRRWMVGLHEHRAIIPAPATCSQRSFFYCFLLEQHLALSYTKTCRLHWNVLWIHFLSAMLEYYCKLMLKLTCTASMDISRRACLIVFQLDADKLVVFHVYQLVWWFPLLPHTNDLRCQSWDNLVTSLVVVTGYC